MNKAQREAIRMAIGNTEDNLYRARMAKEGNPNWMSGNGETIDEVIADYAAHLAALKEVY